MRIIVIADYLKKESSVINALREVCEIDSINFCHSIDNAKEFTTNNIVKNQIPLDLVIIFSWVGLKNANEFQEWVKFDIKGTYSKNDFNLRELPILLVTRKDESLLNYKDYDGIVSDKGNEHLDLLTSQVNLVVKDWRKRIIDELDNIGIKYNSGIIDYTYYLSKRRVTTLPQTFILSENFKLFPRKLNYYWLEVNKTQIEKSIDEFIKLLKRSERLGKKGEEKLYHKFFNDNEYFLKRDNYSKVFYESKLMKNEKEYEEPDYTLKPNFDYKTDLSLLEVKLPNELFMTKKRYHRTPRMSLIKHIVQVNDYKDYLESDEYKSQINKVFGYVPKKINYQLLVGRKIEKLKDIEGLDRTMRQLGQGNIGLMTYDDLADYQVKFLERIKLLEIK
jgi:hypothetical protein